MLASPHTSSGVTGGWSGAINLDAATNRAQFVAGVIESKDERTLTSGAGTGGHWLSSRWVVSVLQPRHHAIQPQFSRNETLADVGETLWPF